MFTQAGVGTSPGYDAIDLRRAGIIGQEGVMAAGSYMVTQRGAGANMSVDIAATTIDAATGIAAIVQGDAVTGQGLYPVPAHSAVINETISAAHATLPRVDAVILEVQDTTHDASGANLARTRVVTGTATAGATLDNARDGSHGGAAIPSSALHLADVLVGAAAGSITNAVIRDRRQWARGAYSRTSHTAGANVTRSSGTEALIDATNVQPRVECSGNILRCTLRARVSSSIATVQGSFAVFVDGVLQTGARSYFVTPASTAATFVNVTFDIIPTAGSHRVGPAWSSDGTNILTAVLTDAATPLVWTVEEIVRQNTPNNSTTTG